MTRKVKYGLLATGGISVVVLVLLFVLWQGFLHAGFENEETAYVYVRPESDTDDICAQLEALGGSHTRLFWSLANKVKPYRPRTGRYAVEPGQTFLTTYLNLRRGHQTPVRLTIPSVRTLDRLAGVLGQKLMLDSVTLATAFYDSAFAATYGYNTATLPALFIPNTYEVYWDTSLEKFMQRMVRENKDFWSREGRNEAALSIGLSHEEVSTLASIVEEETANAAEKPRVAGLYMNRIHKGIPLQADPTVKFAVGDATLRRILGNHLKTVSPYNTYINQGLPPGPIRIPSVVGIDAVLHHEHHDFLYMCAKEDFSGTHNFAVNFAEHKQNARRYQQALNARGIH